MSSRNGSETEQMNIPRFKVYWTFGHRRLYAIVALKSKVRCKDIELRASSVIISQSLVPSLEASISTILSNKNVRPNREGIACVANTHWRIEKKAMQWRMDHGKRWTGGLESL